MTRGGKVNFSNPLLPEKLTAPGAFDYSPRALFRRKRSANHFPLTLMVSAKHACPTLSPLRSGCGSVFWIPIGLR